MNAQQKLAFTRNYEAPPTEAPPSTPNGIRTRAATLKGWSRLTTVLRKTTDEEQFSESKSFLFGGSGAPWTFKSRCLTARVGYRNDD